MIKKLKKGLIQLMVAVLAFSVIPPYVPKASETEAEPKSKEITAPPPQTKTSKKPTEIKSERAENEVVYDNHDGSFTKQIFADPVHVKVGDKMERVDADLKQNKQKQIIEPKTTEIKTKFLTQTENGTYQMLTEKGAEASFRMTHAKAGQEEIPFTDQTANINENEIIYPNVYPGVDFRHLTFNRSLKEDLVLREKNKIDTYFYQIETKLLLEQTKEGEIVFKDKEGHVKYTLPKPIMTDSKVDAISGEATSSENVHFELKKLTKTVYELALKVDTDWLASPERAYPVYIDPSIRFDDIYNANVSSASPNTNFTGSKLWDSGQKAYTLKIGQYDRSTGCYDAYLKMDTSTLQKAKIEKATLNVYNKWHSYANKRNELAVGEVEGPWSPWQITWNKRPTQYTLHSVDVGRGEWARFDVRSTIQAWASGMRPNYGFKLATNPTQDHWKKVIASENNTQAPYLEVTYTYPEPKKPTVKTYANEEANGTGYMEVSWPEIPGAEEYEVVLSNGKEEAAFSAGKKTSWSSKGKRLFPTQEELKQGAYAFHEDGRGQDLLTDPRAFYENAYQALGASSLRNETYYPVRIRALFKGGESPTSEAAFAYLPLATLKEPKAAAYSNLAGKETGYVHLNWEKMPLADGYKVLIFNGRTYESFDVGNKTEWSTQGQKIWPTAAEIENGRYALHHDDKGGELARDPSPVYRNSGGNYSTRKNYWFRVVAYQKSGPHAESEWSEPAVPIIPEGISKQLGMVDYWTSIPVRGGEINATNGNFLFHEKDLELSGRGPSIDINRTFNSQDEGVGLFGKGWTSTLEERIIEEANGDLLWVEADKKVHRFKKKGADYEAPSGIHSKITKSADGFLKIEEDKSEIRFLKDGRLASEKDTHGNTLTYHYTNSKLTRLTDASDRSVTLTYEGERITKITGPENRVITFTYNDQGELTASSTARGKMYRYGYTDGKLTAIYDPKHTEKEPYQTTYRYEEEKLAEITDPVGKKTTIAYDTKAQTATLTNEKKKQTVYEYNDAGNPQKQIVDATGLKLTTTYTYQSNHLKKEVSPKGQEETYEYDANGNITKTTDPYGTESYTYNQNNDVTSTTDNEGRKTTVAYQGTDAVSETIKTESPRSSAAQYDRYGNVIRGSGELASGNNLLQNSGFENGDLTGWTMIQSGAKGQIKHDRKTHAPGGLGGSSAVKIDSAALSTSKGYTAATQSVDVEPETTYTFSAWIKAADMKAAEGLLIARLKEANGRDIADDGSEWRSNRQTSVKKNSGWVKRQLTFKTSKNTRKVLLYLDNEQDAPSGGSGTVWYDKVQFEKGSTASSYNPVANNSFEDHNTVKPTGWIRTGDPSTAQAKVDDDHHFSGDSAVYFERKSDKVPSTHIAQDIEVNQQEAGALTLTALSKSEEAKVNGSTHTMSNDYSIWGTIAYQDGTTSSVQGRFPLGTNDWNRSAVVIKPEKPIKKIKVYTDFRAELTGKAWFDDVCLMEGEVLTQSEYDEKGNYLTASYDEAGRKTSFTYDTYGNKTTETDEKGNRQTFAYDADNALTSTTLANGTTVSYKYDDNGNTTEKKITADGKTQKNSYTYDVDNKITQFTDPLGRAFRYEYDASGNETKAIMPNGRVTENTYDSADRLSSVTWNDKPAFRFQYDAGGNQTQVTDEINHIVTEKVYDGADRIKKVSDRGGNVQYTYKDQPTKDNKGKTDKISEVKIEHQGYNGKTTYAYNDLDQNTRVGDGKKTAYFEYDEFGNVGAYTAGNRTVADYTYDSTQKVTSLSIGDDSGEAILDESYTYDATKNRTSIDNKQLGKTTYEYDAVGQLKKETLPNGTIKDYTYDGFGNRTNVTISGKETKQHTARYNEGNQLIEWNGQKFTYDENGNRTSDGKYTYTWDTGDRLVAVTKKGASKPFVTYTYDDDNRRLSKTVNGVVTNYHYDGDSINVLYETDGTGKVTRQYVYSDNHIRLAMKMNGKTLYYHYNSHGDVIALTDETGKVVAKYQYDAWGNVLQSEATTPEAKANPYGYAGYTYDQEIGQYYLIARYYEPEQGVFTAYDPDPGDEDDPQTMNGYNYANNNPVMYVDPDGNWVWHVIGGILGAFSGYREAKSRGYSGWRMFGSILGGAALGTVGGFGFKVATRTFKSASKVFKSIKKRVKSKKKIKNVRTKKKRIYKSNITKRQLERRLKKKKWKKERKENGVLEFKKNGRKITTRSHSSAGPPTAEYFGKGVSKRKKFRLKGR